jgi:hypothetical protein
MIPDNAWQSIWDHVVREFRGDIGSFHGSAHWRRVERNGLLLAPRTGAVVDVVRLFAVFHDSRREQDGWDGGHGARAADYAASLRGVLFELNDAHLELLRYACTWEPMVQSNLVKPSQTQSNQKDSAIRSSFFCLLPWVAELSIRRNPTSRTGTRRLERPRTAPSALRLFPSPRRRGVGVRWNCFSG